MANQWNRVKSLWSRLFDHREHSDGARPVRASLSADQRHENIEGQIVALVDEIDGLKSEIEIDCDSWDGDVAITYAVRQMLMRARDLRYKGGLLRAELQRSCPGSDFATSEFRKASRSEDPSSRIREVANRILKNADFARTSQRTTFEMAVRDLLGSTPDKQRVATKLLGKLRLPESVPLFRAALAFDDDMLQAECLRALVALNESSAVAELESCLKSPSYKLRLAALRGLYNLKSPDSGSACMQCLADWNPEVRRSAATFLGLQNTRAAAPALAVLLRDENVDVRIAAARTLETLCSEHTVYMLIRALEDEEISVRTAAKSALTRTLSVPLDIDVHQEPDILFPMVETLLGWWSKARADGLPWSVPVFVKYKEPHLVGE